MSCLHCSSCQFGGSSYSSFFFCFFRKRLYFGSEWLARDKLVFRMKKHNHVSSQILTGDFYNLDLGTEPLINMLLIVFFYSFSPPFFIYIYPNFCLGFPFGFSTYWVRTSYLTLGLLEAHAWCLPLPQCRAWRYPLMSLVTPL